MSKTVISFSGLGAPTIIFSTGRFPPARPFARFPNAPRHTCLRGF
jgi:hypothetical protein